MIKFEEEFLFKYIFQVMLASKVLKKNNLI